MPVLYAGDGKQQSSELVASIQNPAHALAILYNKEFLSPRTACKVQASKQCTLPECVSAAFVARKTDALREIER